MAEEGGRGKVKEAQGKAKEGKAAQKVAPRVMTQWQTRLPLQYNYKKPAFGPKCYDNGHKSPEGGYFVIW